LKVGLGFGMIGAEIMAIQAQWYPNNSASPFWNNGHCAAAGFMDSGISFQHKHQQQQQLAEQHLGELCNGTQGTVDPNIRACSSEVLNSPMFAIQFEKQWEEIDQYIKSEVRIHTQLYDVWFGLVIIINIIVL